jgi:hypothetical protein
VNWFTGTEQKSTEALDEIADVENVVCSVGSISRHQHLHQYMKPATFEVIIGSHTLSSESSIQSN